MADDNGELPEGWARVTLGELVQPSSEKVEPNERPDAPYLSLEHIEPHTSKIIGRGRGTDVNSTKAVFRAGDVLYGKLRPYLNKVVVPDFDGICSTDILVFRPREWFDARFLMYFLTTPAVVEFANHNATGVQLPRIGFDTLGTLEMALPPLTEQRRLVAAVEAVLAKVSAARERLNRVPALLKRFRQAVLAAACSGRLTADWREQNPTVSPSAAEWIYSTDEKRRATTEGQKLRRLGEPHPALIDDLPGWCATRVGEITECLDHLRIPVKKENRGAGNVPYYGANGRTGWTDQHLFDEDLVLVVEDESFIGRERPFSYVVRGKSWVNNHAHALRPLGGMSADYLDTMLAYYDFVPLTSGTTGRRKLNQAALLAAPLNIAPPQEQGEIVRRVGELFSLADVIETRLAEARRSADRLTQAVLAKAFRGELVPTESELARRENRTYEPAADLLARVRAARTQPDTRPARPRKPKAGSN